MYCSAHNSINFEKIVLTFLKVDWEMYDWNLVGYLSKNGQFLSRFCQVKDCYCELWYCMHCMYVYDVIKHLAVYSTM